MIPCTALQVACSLFAPEKYATGTLRGWNTVPQAQNASKRTRFNTETRKHRNFMPHHMMYVEHSECTSHTYVATSDFVPLWRPPRR